MFSLLHLLPLRSFGVLFLAMLSVAGAQAGGLGNLVFADMNGNGRADAGEGIAGVKVQVFTAAADPLSTAPLAETVTSSAGIYGFSGLADGSYKLFIPPAQFAPGAQLHGASSVVGTGSDAQDDDALGAGDDGLDSATPATTGISTADISLAAGTEPTSSETGTEGSSDAANDADVDLTQDFGFTFPSGKVRIGNLIFVDANLDGNADAGEGVAGVTVELLERDIFSGVDTLVATRETAADGHFLFTDLPGAFNYVLRVPASEFVLGQPLFACKTLAAVGSGDDSVDQDGLETTWPEVAGVSTDMFQVEAGFSPTAASGEDGLGASADDFQDSDSDLTRDIGFVRLATQPLSIGNLVFYDENRDGNADSGEGIAGVKVQLYRYGDPVGQSAPVAEQDTDGAGLYRFTGLAPGFYFVHLPSSEFATGEPLAGKVSLTGAGEDNQVDDSVDENGVDTATPGVDGISSVLIELTENAEPTEAGQGAALDDADDNNGDMTVDFGFSSDCPQIVISPASPSAGTQGQAYSVSFSAASAEAPLSWSIVSGSLHSGLSLNSAGLLSGTPTVNGPRTFVVRVQDSHGCSSVAQVTLTVNPAADTVGLGNVVFLDRDGDSVADANEGVSGVTVALYHDGDDPALVPALATTDSGNGGSWSFLGLAPGSYFVRIPPAEFQTGGQLVGSLSIPGAGTDSGTDDSSDENGQDVADPAAVGVRSGVIALALGTEPTTSETGLAGDEDAAVDANVDLTVDLGFRLRTVGVGNVVFLDANGDGLFTTGEGVDGVTVRLFPTGANPASATPLAIATTANGGRFLFSGLEAGSYFLHVPWPNFGAAKPLHQTVSVTGAGADNGVDDSSDENGLDSLTPSVNGVSTASFTLYPGTEATDATSELGTQSSEDNATDADIDLTQDLGFTNGPATSVGVGNLIYRDLNHNGTAEVGEGMEGIAVQLFRSSDNPQLAAPFRTTTSGTNGRYLFTGLPAGQYRVRIPPAMFQLGAPLHGLSSVPGNGADTGADDSVDENGIDTSSATSQGVLSAVIALSLGAEPVTGGQEAGQANQEDDDFDANIDLTVDFGFASPCPEFSIADPGLNTGVLGAPYTQTLSAQGNPSGPLSWSVISGTLPSGLSLSSAGVLSGNPTQTYSAVVTLRVTAADGCRAEKAFLLTVLEPLPLMGVGNMIFRDSNADGHFTAGEGVSGVSVQLHSEGADPGSASPVDTAVTAEDGSFIVGTDTPGNYFLHVPASQFALGAGLANMISLSGSGSDNAVDDDTDENGQDAVSPATTGVSSHVFALAENAEPTAETGAATYLDDSKEDDFDLTLDLGFVQGATPLTVMLSNSNAPRVTVPYTTQFLVNDGTAPYSFSVTSGTPPAGLSLASNGLLTGTATSTTPATFTVTAVDSTGRSGSRTQTLTPVTPSVITVSPSSVAVGTVGHAYDQVFTAVGGDGPYTWGITAGSLPSGMFLRQQGAFAGTPTQAGSFPLTVRALDAFGCPGEVQVTLVVGNEMSLGNRVYLDANANGRADASEGVAGVTVQLFRSTQTINEVPVASAVTGQGGSYLLTALVAGQYYLHVPAVNFGPSATAPLYHTLSAPGVSSGDDDLGEDGQDASAPASTGVSTASFSLVSGALPTSADTETGLGASADDAADTDTDLTRDFGFVDASTLPANFTAWSAALPSGHRELTSNPDADGRSNLIEYAFLLSGTNGLENPAHVFRITENPVNDQLSVQYRRRRGGTADLSYFLELSSGGTWTVSSLVPSITINGDGSETVLFTNFTADPALNGAVSGLARVRVYADSTGDGVPDTSDVTHVLGFRLRTLSTARSQTYAVPYVPQPLFQATIDSTSGDTLTLSTSLGSTSLSSAFTAGLHYYAEVLSGDHAGHRMEVDEASSAALSGQLKLDLTHSRTTLPAAPATLEGDLIAVRPHWRVIDLFPLSDFTPASSQSLADQIQLYDNATKSYTLLWLSTRSGGRWLLAGDATFADQGSRVITPCEGLFVKPRATGVAATGSGILRTWPMACPLTLGANLVGNPFSIGQSPGARGMTSAAGFTASSAANSADRISFWNGDAAPDLSYTNYFLRNTSPNQWRQVGDATLTNHTSSLLFPPGTAAFITTRAALPNWVIPAPALP